MVITAGKDAMGARRRCRAVVPCKPALEVVMAKFEPIVVWQNRPFYTGSRAIGLNRSWSAHFALQTVQNRSSIGSPRGPGEPNRSDRHTQNRTHEGVRTMNTYSKVLQNINFSLQTRVTK